jgi:hypothetical protein
VPVCSLIMRRRLERTSTPANGVAQSSCSRTKNPVSCCEHSTKQRLLRAYRRTIYQVADVRFKVGRRSLGLDDLLVREGVRTAVLLGADNPMSQRKPEGWNQRMRVHLAERLRRRTILPASGQWRGWSERHFLVLGDVAPSRKLALTARQNGIVILRRGQPAQLKTISGCPAPRQIRQSFPSW